MTENNLQDRSQASAGDSLQPWLPLLRSERIAVGFGVVVIVLVTLPRLPPGVCYGDSGDLQLAARTLGIMHPPGYTGFVTIGYLASLVPGADPAYMINLACLASGIIALWLCMMLQIRLGVNACVACAIALSLTATNCVWTNLITPEVYAPSLMFLVSAAYLLVKYGRLGRRRDLYLAALLFGVALANRPTVVWTLPFFLAAWWGICRQRREPVAVLLRTLPMCILLVSLPGIYALGYLWVRDNPETTYNYLELKRTELGGIPDLEGGTKAKLDRLWWQATAREFAIYMGNSWHGVKNRIRWLSQVYFLYRPVLLGIVLVVVACGLALTLTRCPVSGLLLLGISIGNVVFICTYNIYGNAADLLPILWSSAVLGGVATSVIIDARPAGSRRAVALATLAVAAACTFWFAPKRELRTQVDATEFLKEVDLQTMPKGAMICSTWQQSTALWYGQFLETNRDDIVIVNTTPELWLRYAETRRDKPVFIAHKTQTLPGYAITPFRNIFRVERRSED